LSISVTKGCGSTSKALHIVQEDCCNLHALIQVGEI
jgi:hypothetical protein